MALADVYDALISKRVYKPPFPHAKAVQIIQEGRGTHFDPDVVDAFVALEETFRNIALTFADCDEEREALGGAKTDGAGLGRGVNRVLLAEDNPINREIMLSQLTALGYTVDEAANGKEALRKYQAEPSDLLLTDIEMPELDGYGLAAEIRRLEQDGRPGCRFWPSPRAISTWPKKAPAPPGSTATCSSRSTRRCWRRSWRIFIAEPTPLKKVEPRKQVHSQPPAAGSASKSEAIPHSLRSQIPCGLLQGLRSAQLARQNLPAHRFFIFRSRMDFGVTSTSSSSLIYSMACSRVNCRGGIRRKRLVCARGPDVGQLFSLVMLTHMSCVREFSPTIKPG